MHSLSANYDQKEQLASCLKNDLPFNIRMRFEHSCNISVIERAASVRHNYMIGCIYNTTFTPFGNISFMHYVYPYPLVL